MTYISEKYAAYIAEKNDRDGAPYQVIYDFPNGFSASVVQGPYTYGSDEGLFEVGVLTRAVDGLKRALTYDTWITDDVLGYQSEADVDAVLGNIMALGSADDVLRDAQIASITEEIASHMDAVDALTKKLAELELS